MTSIWIWGVAAVAYLVFRAWYDNWRGPVTPSEVDAFMAKAKALGADANNNLDVVRRFLTEDDGREFIMLNLVRVCGELLILGKSVIRHTQGGSVHIHHSYSTVSSSVTDAPPMARSRLSVRLFTTLSA